MCAEELKHKDIGQQITYVEYHATNAHEADGQTEGDVLWFNGTSWVRIPLIDLCSDYASELLADSIILDALQDMVGAMFSGNTETFITATYQDADGTIDLVVPVLDEDNMASNSATHLATQQSIKAYVDALIGTAEEVADTVGAMLTGNTETFITVTYQDDGNTIDFVVPVLDEDTMASDSAVHLPTQQSVKAYVDTHASDTSTHGASDIADVSDIAVDANLSAAAQAAIAASHAQGTDTALGAVGTKNPPIDADKAIYRDSTASDALVTSTWTQIKAFLKTYFDGLYGGGGQDDLHAWDIIKNPSKLIGLDDSSNPVMPSDECWWVDVAVGETIYWDDVANQLLVQV